MNPHPPPPPPGLPPSLPHSQHQPHHHLHSNNPPPRLCSSSLPQANLFASSIYHSTPRTTQSPPPPPSLPPVPVLPLRNATKSSVHSVLEKKQTNKSQDARPLFRGRGIRGGHDWWESKQINARPVLFPNSMSFTSSGAIPLTPVSNAV